MSSDTRQRAREVDTYRYLRLIMVVPAAWLLMALVAVLVFLGAEHDSISDYYGTPLRDVFVGALMACGICMIAYKGESKLEDYALNFAGFNAFLVALVPNSYPEILSETRNAEDESSPLPFDASSSDLLIYLAVAVLILLALAAAFVIADFRLFQWTRFHRSEQTALGNAFIIISWVGEGIVVLALIRMLYGMVSGDEATIREWSVYSMVHFSAAITLVVNLSLAASSYGLPGKLRTSGDAPPPTLWGQRGFRAIAGAMWVGIAGGIVGFILRWDNIIFWTEFAEIFLFLDFWILAVWRLFRESRTHRSTHLRDDSDAALTTDSASPRRT